MSTFDISPHVLRPQQERSRAALAKIVQAAEKILRKDGIDGFSMAAVAEAADLPVGNIYRRFKGKDELLQAIKHDVTSRIEMAVAARLSQQQFSDIPTLVRALVGAASKTFASDETLYRIVFDSRTQNPVLNQIGLSGRHRIFAAYREALLPFLEWARPALTTERSPICHGMYWNLRSERLLLHISKRASVLAPSQSGQQE